MCGFGILWIGCIRIAEARAVKRAWSFGYGLHRGDAGEHFLFAHHQGADLVQ
jgi:hypothetical protein